MDPHPINGAAQRVGADETAFGHRDKRFAPVIVGIWPDPADNEANTKWVRDYYAAIHPHSGSAGGYVNFMSGDDAHRTAENYGANYGRLSAVKAAYDPETSSTSTRTSLRQSGGERHDRKPENARTSNGLRTRHLAARRRARDRSDHPGAQRGAERKRRLSQPVLKALRETVLLRMTTPRSLGGSETDPVTGALVAEEIGRHDSAAAWTLENPLDWAFFCCRLPDEGAEEIYSGGADILIAAQFGRPLRRHRPTAATASPAEPLRQQLSLTPTGSRRRSSWMPGDPPAASPSCAWPTSPARNARSSIRGRSWGCEARAATTLCDRRVRAPLQDLSMEPEFEPGSHYRGPLYRLPVVGAAAAGIPTPMLGVARRTLDEVTHSPGPRRRWRRGRLKERASAQAQLGQRKRSCAPGACCFSTPWAARGAMRRR